MIPQRVYLCGFLCYRDKQEIRFDGSSLWMLSGLNGSGKSSIFDAVTYALFGHHRGGSQHAHELINKDSNSATVEFDFTQDGQLYRVKRTLQRNARGGATGTQQILRWQPAETPGASGNWVAVPDTNRKAEFDAWIREHIGLDYTTFTSSVLLLQGKAEKLLDSTAKGRFEVLAGIVDLERYQRLHEKADGRRKALKNHRELLHNQLEALPAVSELELVAAENRIADVEEARKQAAAEVERWQGLEFEAKRWAELQMKLTRLRGRWQQAEALLKDAPVIEKDIARLRELREVLPHVETVLKQRRQAQEAENCITALSRQRQELDAKLAEKTLAAEQARQKREQVRKRMAEDEQRLREIGEELRRMESILERGRECERQRQVLARQEAELARLPADTLQAQEQAQQRCDQVAALAQVLPLLERLHDQRDELRQALHAEAAKAREEQEVKKKGEQLKSRHAALAKQAEVATQVRQKADQELSAAQALFRQLEDAWRAFTELEGARTCRQCGQPLTPGHFEMEKAKREQEVAAARARCRQAAEVQQASIKEEQRLQKELKELEHKLEQAREEYREARSGLQQARRDIERCQNECAQAYRDLPESHRTRVGTAPPDDWLATTYPTTSDLDGARKEARTLDELRRRLREAQALHGQWCRLQAQAATTRQAVAALEAELPRDLPAVQQKYIALEAEKATLTTRLNGSRSEEKSAEAERERLQKECEALQKQRAEREARINAEEATRKHSQQAVAAAYKLLPPAWQQEADAVGLSGLHSWQDEKEQLEEAGTEARARALEQARLSTEELRQQLQAVEAEAEQVPAEARRPVAEVQASLRRARSEYELRDEAFRKAQQEYVVMQGQRQRREELQQQALEMEREYKVLEQLTKLLGRDRLQLYLVRQAERQIVDHANAVLDRLSGGQLYLRLCSGKEGEGNADQALDLEAYNRTTGQQPINVAFLSGSQRFRVAVSLALGIGQYASRQHRPIESVIIDEGFGCLDRNGRQVMIQELQNLRGQLNCILLVSHQEEFADAFNDGYHFELDNGSTRVTRIRR